MQASTEENTNVLKNEQLSKGVVALVALIQGLILAFVYARIEAELWPANSSAALNAIVVFSISLPSLFILISDKNDWRKIATYLLVFCAVLASLGAYVGSIEIDVYSDLMFIFSLCAIVASFKAVLYIKCLSNNTPMSYATLFTASWRNFVLGAETVLFCGIFFAILFLGANLFSTLGITFFETLLDNHWFWVPALTLSGSLAIHVFRNIIHTIDTAATILQTLMKFLLPLLVIVSIGFVSTLPFTGLEKLWATGSGTALVLTLQALTLFFVNAVYQEGSEQRPYAIYLHRMVIVGVIILPLYSIIAAYGLWLRIDQYGFSVGRSWAVLVCVVFALFSFGYFVGIVRLRDNWLHAQSKINVAMGLFVMLITLLIQSPLINFQSIAAASQISRLTLGEVSYEEFDFDYFVNQLHQPGKAQLDALKLKIADERPDIVKLIDQKYAWKIDREEILKTPEEVEFYWPSKQAVAPDFLSYLYDKEILKAEYDQTIKEVYVVGVDANNDVSIEYLVITQRKWSRSRYVRLYYFENGIWNESQNSDSIADDLDIKALLKSNNIITKPPKWQNIQIGDMLIETN